MAELDNLSTQEIARLQTVYTWKQPLCPGCGQPMRLIVLRHRPDHDPKPGEPEAYSVRYSCIASKATCGVWATHVMIGPLPAAMAEQAWRDATRRSR